jgi:hypothetical protein
MTRSHRHPRTWPLLVALVGCAGCGSVSALSVGDAATGAGDDGGTDAPGDTRVVRADGGTGALDATTLDVAVASSDAPADRSGGGGPEAGGAPEAAPGPSCGNGVVEPGEQCDPPGTCPTACPNRGCTTFKLQGSAPACTAICVESGKQTACAPDDGCCPAGCTANQDNDCAVVCDNGVKEGKETCDPLSSCPTACPAQGCQLRKLINGGTCQATCENAGMQQACIGGDGCCPASCNNTNDSDCPRKCGNGVVEAGETCDPIADCQRQQAACQSDQNTIRTGSGDPNACTFRCATSPRACGPADGACPSGCSVDPDCLPRPTNCTEIQFCHNPNSPDQNMLICITNKDARCTDAERIAECAREATSVCGQGHARPIVYRPPIGGRGTD